jgi:hypothetical protein
MALEQMLASYGIPAAVIGLIVAFAMFAIIIGIAIYIYMAFALMAIAKKAKTENAWLAWIPIGNIYLLTQVAKVSGWWTLGIFAGGIPAVGSLAVLALMVWLWWRTSERLGFPNWFGILMVVPIANLIILGILAWGKAK